jgi:hypothetical protein
MQLDNRALDGFIDRFLTESCIDVDCERCRYCHDYADRALCIDPGFREQVLGEYAGLFEDMHAGSFWQQLHPRDLVDAARLTSRVLKSGNGASARAKAASPPS